MAPEKMDSSKEALLPLPLNTPRKGRGWTGWRLAGAVMLGAAGVLNVAGIVGSECDWEAHGVLKGGPSKELDLCPQVNATSPPADPLLEANKLALYTEEYRNLSAGILSGIVQIPSESYDTTPPVGESDKWDVFFDIAAYLERTFPEVHDKLSLTKVNTHGLLYEWKGTDPNLKPVILMAHQDVVPVNWEVADEWTHAPYSGHYDGRFVWGRGASDCKNMLTAELEAITFLLKGSFVPKRTILLSYGFDEESKGQYGAESLAAHIEELYGPDGIEFILDEGGLGLGELFGSPFALPSTGEKGYLDVNVTLHTAGGHSSIPPPHTNLGILADFITLVESEPWVPTITEESPMFSMLQCVAQHAPKLDAKLKKGVRDGSKKGSKGKKARKAVAHAFAALGLPQKYLLTTSQAVDLISGGVKVNALPEVAYTVINHRIAIDGSVEAVESKITRELVDVAKRHKLNVTAFGKDALSSPDAVGAFKAVGINELSPAPFSPLDAPSWALLAGVIKHVYSHKFKEELTVSPSVMTGNTDTKAYWRLTNNIYRFTPMDRTAGGSGTGGIHTVNEHLLFDDHIDSIWFFHELLRASSA